MSKKTDNGRMLKSEMVDFLQEAGYDRDELEALNVEKLQKLVSKEKKEANEKKVEVEDGAEVLENGDVNSEDTEVSDVEISDEECRIFNMRTTEYVRTFSKAKHGRKFRDIAKEFVAKHTDCFIKDF